MSKIAVIYTGELRTIESTIQLFKKNVLKNNDFHVFAVLQSNDNKDYYETFIKDILKDNIKSLIWLDKYDDKWVQIRNELVKNINIDNYWKNYLINSGSMIEYYQSYLSYNEIQTYEKINNINYDFILRFRTDTVLKDEICFDINKYTKEYIKQLLTQIMEFKSQKSFINKEVLTNFITSLFFKNRHTYCNNGCYINTSKLFNDFLQITDEDIFIHKIHDYIIQGNFLIALRNNVIYFVKRNLYEKISILGITYGKYIKNDTYWFNSENQLEQICIDNNIDLFSSTTQLEDSSLYKYNKQNYYNDDDTLKYDEFSFFIKRY